MTRWLTITLLLTLAGHALAVEDPLPTQRKDWKVRWLLLKYWGNELREKPETWPAVQRYVRRADEAGYNGIVFMTRAKWFRGEHAALWQQRLGELGKLVKSLGMQWLVTCVFAKGGGTAEMAESFPVRDAPLVVKDGVLVPVPTAEIRNGSFEEFEGDIPTGFSLPEAGKHAFIDQTGQAYDGETCIRVENFEEVRGRLAMPVQRVAVKPFHQYRVSFRLKISDDFKSNVIVMALVPGEGGKDRDICYQQPIVGRKPPRNKWFSKAATFNSWDNEKVSLLVGPINWGKGTKGTFWLDDIRITDVPFLNVNRRPELPNKITDLVGRAYKEGRDYARIMDPKCGWAWGPKSPNHYGVRQGHPEIAVLPGGALREGQKVLYTGYHIGLYGRYYGKTPSLTYDGVFKMYADEVRTLRRAADPDGYLIWFDEMRVGGWEPKSLEFETCGQMINAALQRTYQIVMREGGGKPIHSWHDMFTPTHNARANYYLMRNTCEGAGKNLPKGLNIWIWGGGSKGAEHMKFFAKQGLRQIFCTYYDTPRIDKQYQGWMKAMDALGADADRLVDGVVYSTWSGKGGDGFEDIEEFAEVWWGGGDGK